MTAAWWFASMGHLAYLQLQRPEPNWQFQAEHTIDIQGPESSACHAGTECLDTLQSVWCDGQNVQGNNRV